LSLCSKRDSTLTMNARLIGMQPRIRLNQPFHRRMYDDRTPLHAHCSGLMYADYAFCIAWYPIRSLSGGREGLAMGQGEDGVRLGPSQERERHT
jgi:hypothetical protein